MNYSTKSTGYTKEQLIQNIARCLEAVGRVPHEHRGQVYGGSASLFEDKAVILPVLVAHRRRTARDPRHAEQDIKVEIYSGKTWTLQGTLNYFKKNGNPDLEAMRFLAEVAGSQSITQHPARSPEDQFFEALNRASNVFDGAEVGRAKLAGWPTF